MVIVMLIGYQIEVFLLWDLFNVYLVVVGLFDMMLVCIVLEYCFISMVDNVFEMFYQMWCYLDGKCCFMYVSKGVSGVFGLLLDELLVDVGVFGNGFVFEDWLVYEVVMVFCEMNGVCLNQVFCWLDWSGGVWYILFNVMLMLQEDGSVVWDGVVQDIIECEQFEVECKCNFECLESSMEKIVEVIVVIIEMCDFYIVGYQCCVVGLVWCIVEEMYLFKDEVYGIYVVVIIYDIGKIYIFVEILSFFGKLGEIEYVLIKVYVQVGYDILKNIEFFWLVVQMVYQYYEYFDGSGYLCQLKGNEIMFGVCILCVVDVVELMVFYWFYWLGLGIGKVLVEIWENCGWFYDEIVVDVCLDLFVKGYEFV